MMIIAACRVAPRNGATEEREEEEEEEEEQHGEPVPSSEPRSSPTRAITRSGAPPTHLPTYLPTYLPAFALLDRCRALRPPARGALRALRSSAHICLPAYLRGEGDPRGIPLSSLAKG